MPKQNEMLTNKRKGNEKMIKIIEHGTIRKQKCQHCGCLFSYESEDIKAEKDDEYMFHGFSKKYINCPQCEYKIILGGIK